MMAALKFTAINRDRQDDYLKILAQTPQVSSDYSFVNIWAWAEEYDLTWAWQDGLVWLRQESPSPAYWAPIGNWHEIDWNSYLAGLDERLPFNRVPEVLADLWQAQAGDLLQAVEAREHWDYIYDTKKLIDLSGNRLHKKKNLLTQFKKKHVWHYQAIDKHFIDQVLLMQLDWCNWRNCEASAGLAAEDRVIQKVLRSYTSMPNMLGGSLVVNEFDMVAFTVAEVLQPDTLVIHFEKGMSGYKGVYQAINQMFLAANPGFALVNREQDLGNVGLREAKMSYKPVTFLKKYNFNW
jgi:hypothetical protein